MVWSSAAILARSASTTVPSRPGVRGESEPVQQRGRTVVLLELAGRVRAVALDADTGGLEFVPNSPACGKKLRWSAPK
ncbi:hypothetical protein [Streptomyces syringium]|uniref:hypothetical protein n=1 Tax=Streptomyces syringium TaxID=76729 RepID=UPI003453120F